MIATPAIAVGASIFIQRGFDPTRLLDLIESERLTLTFALPMMYRAMLEHLGQRARDVTSLRLAIYAMAPMPTHELRNAIETFGCDFALMFGQTEMNPLSVYFRPEHQLSHPGAVGTPSPNVQVAIMDQAGRFLPQGQSGEIVYRSPQVMSGYLHDPAATDAAFAHGWFHSGDCGHFDPDGILWFEDRFKDVIKTGGENVASIEVEKALYAADPCVQEAAGGRATARTLGRSGHRGGHSEDRTDDRRRRAFGQGADPSQPLQMSKTHPLHRSDAEDRDRQNSKGQIAEGACRNLSELRIASSGLLRFDERGRAHELRSTSFSFTGARFSHDQLGGERHNYGFFPSCRRDSSIGVSQGRLVRAPHAASSRARLDCVKV